MVSSIRGVAHSANIEPIGVLARPDGGVGIDGAEIMRSIPSGRSRYQAIHSTFR